MDLESEIKNKPNHSLHFHMYYLYHKQVFAFHFSIVLNIFVRIIEQAVGNENIFSNDLLEIFSQRHAHAHYFMKN